MLLVVVLVVRLRLAIQQSGEGSLSMMSRLLLPAVCCYLMQGLGDAWIVQQRISAWRVHRKLCDCLRKVALHWALHRLEVRDAQQGLIVLPRVVRLVVDLTRLGRDPIRVPPLTRT